MRLASCRVALPLYLGKALRHLLAQSRLCHTLLLVATALAVPTPNRCLLHHQLQTVLRTDLMSLRLQREPIQSVRRGAIGNLQGLWLIVCACEKLEVLWCCWVVDALAHDFPAIRKVLLEQWLRLPCVGCCRCYVIHVASRKWACHVDSGDGTTRFPLWGRLLKRLIVLEVSRVE